MSVDSKDAERDRLAALDAYQIVDTPPEDDFDQVCRLAAELVRVPVSCISLVERDRVWFKAKVGLQISDIPREQSFCGRAIELGDFIEVSDARKDPRFSDLAVVVQPPRFRFYAGANLIAPGGQVIGTLAVLDTKPRTLGRLQREGLRILAWQVMSLFDLRRKNQELDEALAESERNKNHHARLLAAMSHEIRNSIAPLYGYADLLAETASDRETKQIAERMRRAGQQSLELLNGILDFGRLDCGCMPLHLESLELRPLLLDLMEAMAPAARARGLDLTFIDEWAGPPRLRIDAVRFRQILMNLIGNALKFTDSGGVEVRMHPDEDGACLQLDIIDTGGGVPNAETIFDPYVQGTHRLEGTGLGLPICKQLVSLMGGSIGVDSQPGKGSRFWFTIPAEPEDWRELGA